MFRKILIANRGEIACRIIATARRLGIATVAVYSDADAAARHVAMADEAYRIGPPPAKESYLVIERLLEAARTSGAEAIHPGYGFLSEKAEFAEACAAAGITFIGPPPKAIRAMGLKGAAKAIMEKAGVPVVPGYHGDDQEPARLLEEATRIGYPVLIKAVAGGGGKGMRRVDAADGFAAELASARREASAAFGDDKVLIEKYLLRPRHIEIQVFGDSHGQAVHLFERDCSLQRRHQKVIEEAPAPGMPPGMRAAMGQAAVAAAKAIGYVGAGTVEFIADVSQGLKEDAFYFMEMNTRLQVEHPVTEKITGQDLVEWQLIVAAGGALPLAQDEIALSGHAIEARVYAENPARQFLPATGTLLRLRPPAETSEVRVDTGVREGDAVTPFYDPMIAKLIVWGEDRPTALRRLARALAEYEIAGVTTNVAFLGAIARHPAFAAADLDTGFIERHLADLVPPARPAGDEVLALAALALLLEQRESAAAQAISDGDPFSPWHRVDGFRLNGEGHTVLRFLSGESEIAITARYGRGEGGQDGFRLDLPGGPLAVRGEVTADGTLHADLGGARLRAAVVRRGDEVTVLLNGRAERLKLHDPLAGIDLDAAAGGTLAAPMPGRIVQVLVAAGASVRKGTGLMVLEAMKMEHTIAAPADGRVEAVNFAAGDQVEEGAVLLAFAIEAKG